MIAHSLRLLLSTLIDYAGLFPPKSLDMQSAIVTYEHHGVGPHRWMLGRFVLPLNQLPLFKHHLKYHVEQLHSTTFWPLSVVMEPSLEAIAQLSRWSEEQDYFTIAALEFKPCAPEAIADLLPHLPPNLDLFFELPSSVMESQSASMLDDALLVAYLDVLQQVSASAKVRTGGLTPLAIPSITPLAQLIAACAQAKVPFKATAGVHHPLRSVQSLHRGDLATMHGFLNLALAAIVAYGYDAPAQDIVAILNLNSASHLRFAPQAITYPLTSVDPPPILSPSSSQPIPTPDCHSIPLEVISHVRSQYFRGIGSCSMQTSLNDLHQLGLLVDDDPAQGSSAAGPSPTVQRSPKSHVLSP